MLSHALTVLSPAPAPDKLSYGNFTAAIRRFEAGQALGTRIAPRLAKRGSRFRAIAMMTRENSNPKLAKLGRPVAGLYSTLSLSLAPADMAGIDLCPMRSASCTAGCLGHNSGHSAMGRGAANDRSVMTMVRQARIRRTQALFGSDLFTSHNALQSITAEIRAFVKRCKRRGVFPAVRMNAFSDIVWEKVWPELFTRFPGVTFYDYTKIPSRMYGTLPQNYSLTFSRSETNQGQAISVLQSTEHNVAIVFGVKNPADMPTTWNGFRVIDGTADDMRFLDAPNTIVGLSWKGPTSKAAYTESLTAAIAAGFAVAVPGAFTAPTTSLTR